MKKLMALTLALVLALSLGVTALAKDAPIPEGAKVVREIHLRADGVFFYDMRGNYYEEEVPTTAKIYLIPDMGEENSPDDYSDAVADDGSTISADDLYYSDLYYYLGCDRDVTDFFTAKFKKEEGAKAIKSLKLVSKKIGDVVSNGSFYFDGAAERWGFIEGEMKEGFTGDETKIGLTATYKAKDNLDITPWDWGEGALYLAKNGKVIVDFKFYVKNDERGADADFKAGDGGVVVKPQKNEDNEITWESENDTLAWLAFTSDDNAAKFYPKMTTKWSDQDYTDYFADQDAYLYDFIGNPQIASTSRATLDLRYPFVDEDGELTVDPENAVVYTIGEDGEPVDITSEFQFVETDDGDYVLRTKTRRLGTYIIAGKPAASDAEAAGAPAETAGEAPAGEPAAPVKAFLPSFTK